MVVRRGALSAGVLAASLGILGCASSHVITLSYAGPPPRPGDPRVLVARFEDRRGDEGDRDPFRVGGLYGGVGNRLGKITTTTPWPMTLQAAIVAELRGAGMDAAAQDVNPGSGAVALHGEIRNFSTEARWTRRAHVSGTVRVIDAAGRTLAERAFETEASCVVQVPVTTCRDRAGVLTTGAMSEVLELLLNEAMGRFVRAVAADPGLLAAIQNQR